MKIRLCSFLLTLALVGMMVSPAAAQRRMGPPGGDQSRRPPSERVEQFKKLRLMEVLGLDEQTSIRFFARYNKHHEAMRDIRRQQMEVFQQIQTLRRNQAPDKDYEKVLQDLISLEQQSGEMKREYMDGLSEVLSKKQVAEYIVFELRFQQNLRDLLQEVQRGDARD